MQRLLSFICLFLFIGHAGGTSADHETVHILVLGDSLSSAHNMPVEQGWVRLFSDNIGASFPQTTVTNASISGETTFGGRQRLPTLLERHTPTHLIIELGGNDGLRGLNFDQSTDNLRSMVRMAVERDISVLMVGVRMPPNFGAAYNQRFQQIFASVTDEFDIHFLPRFLEGVAASDPDLMQADGIHPTAKAQPLLARRVGERMSQILEH